MEVYVDDILVKSKTREAHHDALRRVLEIARKSKLKMNPKKCVFGVSAGMLLGFIVSKWGIEVDPSKVRAILEMPPPKSCEVGVRAATKVFRSGEVEFDSTNSCPETNHSDAATFS